MKYEKIKELSDSWHVLFDKDWGGPGEVRFDKLSNWIDSQEEGIKYYSGKATYRKVFDMGNVQKKFSHAGERLALDLGDVKHVAAVRLNGKELGVLWCSPWRVDITDCIKDTGNVLEIDIVNLWANQVIGDWKLPVEKRFTKTHDVFRFDMLRGSTPLTDAGLLGPVNILRGL